MELRFIRCLTGMMSDYRVTLVKRHRHTPADFSTKGARLWLPAAWWIKGPKARPLYEWIRATYNQSSRLPRISSQFLTASV